MPAELQQKLVYALIPARGGSKGIPDKNIRLLAGKPLVAHSVEQALSAPSIDRVFVSTDSPRIAEIARSSGAEVPFLRPPELAQDLSPDLGVFLHWLDWLEEKGEPLPEIVAHFRPTAPIRSVELIEKAVKNLRADPAADSLRTVAVPDQNPFKMWTFRENDGYLKPLLGDQSQELFNQPRQALPPVYWQTATLDLIRTRTLREKNSMTGERVLPLLLPAGAVDIDRLEELNRAEELLRGQSARHNYRA